MKTLKFTALVTLTVALSACGSGTGSDDAQDAGAGDTGMEVPGDPGVDESDTVKVVPPVPWGPGNRGYVDLRGIVHAHSIYSHDGCASDAPPIGSPDSLQCLAEMRAAPCAAGIDFIMQTDHPGNVASTPFLDALHYQPADGDELVRDAKGRVFANKVTCPAGSLVDHFYFYVGAEGGSKQMPVAFAGPDDGVSPGSPEVMNTGYEDDTPLAQSQAALATLHELGGIALSPHTEEWNISVDRMIELPLDGMEIYNFHTNIMDALVNFDELLVIDAFMGKGGPDEPPADLCFLAFLAPVAKDIEKYDAAIPFTRLIHIAANDVHRNVEFPALCGGGLQDGGLCENMSKEYANFANFLVKGGPFPLNDGDRLDSYVRSYRWFSNHTLASVNDADEARKALGAGREFSAFDSFGMPGGFDFFAIRDGAVMEMGDEKDWAAGTTIYLRTPTLAEPAWGMDRVDDFSAAVLKTRLVRATKDGATAVVELDGQGQVAEYAVDGPGAFRVEVEIVPRHLKPALPGVEDLAERTFPYLYSNTIFVR